MGERWVRSGCSDDGAQRPLVAVHTWYGETDKFERLAGALGDVPVLSQLPPDPERDELPRRTEQWVDHHEAVLRSLPVGPPYRLVGWSFGGVVAVELARRLRDAGEAVEYVGLVDTIRPRLLPLSDREFVWYHLGAAAAMPEEQRMRYLRQKTAYLVHRRFPRAGGAARSTMIRFGYRRDRAVKHSVRPTDPLQAAVHLAYLNYRGEGVPFPVGLYATEESLAKAREPVLRWAPWLHGGYDLTVVPGGHFSLFDVGNVEVLADAVRRDLGRLPPDDRS